MEETENGIVEEDGVMGREARDESEEEAMEA